MATYDPKVVQHIKQRGHSLNVSLPKQLLVILGWNKNDILHFQVIDKSMVMTRVEMPKVNELRKEAK